MYFNNKCPHLAKEIALHSPAYKYDYNPIAFTHHTHHYLSARASFTFCNISLFYHPMASNDVTVIKAGYWPASIDNRSNISPSAISTSYFTHLFYASVVPNPDDKYKLKITPQDDQHMGEFTATLHARTPPKKALLSIGGKCPDRPDPNPLSEIFSNMIGTKDTRGSFISSSIENARKYKFDGLELDWEFPKSEDKQNLVSLFEEWRAAIAEESVTHQLLLSAAIHYAYDDEDDKDLVDAINAHVDFVGIRCYDYHGSWDASVTAEHSCLHDPQHPDLNTEHCISRWIKAGLDTKKLVMGLPLYGRSWKLKYSNNCGVGAPAAGVGPGHKGVMRYCEIVQFIHANGLQRHYDQSTQSKYTYAEKNWIGYDDEDTIRRKVEFAKNEKRLRGYFLWEIGYDDGDSLTKAASDAWDGNARAISQ